MNLGGGPCLLRPRGSVSAPGDHPVIGREGGGCWGYVTASTADLVGLLSLTALCLD